MGSNHIGEPFSDIFLYHPTTLRISTMRCCAFHVLILALVRGSMAAVPSETCETDGIVTDTLLQTKQMSEQQSSGESLLEETTEEEDDEEDEDEDGETLAKPNKKK